MAGEHELIAQLQRQQADVLKLAGPDFRFNQLAVFSFAHDDPNQMLIAAR